MSDTNRRTVWMVLLAFPVGVAVAVVGGCARPVSLASPDGPSPESGDRHPVTIRTPAGPPGVPSGAFDEKGRPVTIGCATCHTVRPANTEAKLGTPLGLFHQGLVGKHGDLSCASCHNTGDGYATLRLADGKSVPYSAVMTLCAQCHGPQYRDYRHGAHGGMTGYWDLTRGGRQRNTCTDCHDPHAPKYPTVSPAPGPRDRFQTGGGHE